jgi:hypothetical protein
MTSTEEDNTTVITSNTCSAQCSYKHCTLQHILSDPAFAGASFQLPTKDAIADLGATQIFVMEGLPALNKQPTTCPLCVSLTDRRQVMSTHMCDIKIDGLPFVLTGHIISDLSIASLFGIHILTKAGCEVTFNKKLCTVRYDCTIILHGEKDASTDLWKLPFEHQARPPIMVQPQLCWLPLLFPTPMLIMQQRKLHFSHTPCKTKLIVSNLPIRLFAVHGFLHYSM